EQKIVGTASPCLSARWNIRCQSLRQCRGLMAKQWTVEREELLQRRRGRSPVGAVNQRIREVVQAKQVGQVGSTHEAVDRASAIARVGQFLGRAAEFPA